MTRKLPRHWRPLVRVTELDPPSEALIRETMKQHEIDRTTALKFLEEDAARCEYWVNNLYQVEVRHHGEKAVQLNIRRRDGAVDLRDWRHFQEIKNQLVGEECEGIELYPAESRKVDTSNKWHIWCVKDPTYRVPVGWQEGYVTYESLDNNPGMKQRSL